MYLCDKIFSVVIKAKSDFQEYEGDILTMKRGSAVTAFGEPTKVQSIQVFEWTQERAETLLSEAQANLMEMMKSRQIVHSDLDRSYAVQEVTVTFCI